MFRLPNEIREGIKDYKAALDESISGRMNLARFTGVRVPWGIYSQRGKKVFMCRIRIPAGLITVEQLKAIAYLAKTYGNGIAHITTRQDIQIHSVKIEDTIKVMEYLKDFNLSPRGGGGNTVRNVTGCALSGVCKEEVFDIREYAIGLTEYLLRKDTSYNLPRKFKVCFSGCAKDCAGCLANDLGFLAKYQDAKMGFKVFVAGGMGAESRLGKLLEEFIPEEDLGYCVEAVKNVFYNKGDRKNKHHNRLRFLVEEMGLEEFKKFYQEEFRNLKEKEYIALRKMDFYKEERENEGEIPQIDDKEYREFIKYSLQPQRQKGFLSVQLRIPQGDIPAEKLSSLCDLQKDFGGIEFRTAQNQNICILWVKHQDLYRLFLKLKEILEDFLYPDTLLDVACCKGALTCNLGLCNSPGLAGAIEELVKEEFIGTEVFKRLAININGCPNACGQHPLGKLSFFGMVKRVDNRPVPFYKFLLGGRKELESSRLAEEVGIVPARNTADFLRQFLRRIEEVIEGQQDIHEFLINKAKDIARELLSDFSYVPSYSENRLFYIDWDKTEEFSLAGLGPGECGAGILDMIESDLTEAKICLEEAEKENYSPARLRKALFLSSRALLVVKGKDPQNEDEAFLGFKEKFIEEQAASSKYAGIKDVFASIKEELNPQARKEKFLYAKEFFEHIEGLYKSMDSSFNFPRIEETPKFEAKAGAAKFLDLKGTPCPINYVKTKLVLETLESGAILEVLLDEGEPINNVPRSLEGDGHKILKIEKKNGFYRVVVKKGK